MSPRYDYNVESTIFQNIYHDDSMSPRCDYNVESTIFQNIYTMSIRCRHVAITTSNQRFFKIFTPCRFDVATLRLQRRINFCTRFFKIFTRCRFDVTTLRLQRRNIVLIDMDSIQIRYRSDLATSRYRIDAVKTNLTT
jgi:hypothetical protein